MASAMPTLANIPKARFTSAYLHDATNSEQSGLIPHKKIFRPEKSYVSVRNGSRLMIVVKCFLFSAAAVIVVCKERSKMEIKRVGSQASSKGPADWFTGSVRIDPLFQPNPPARAAAACVTFEPGARTAWHTHPLGQALIVVAGVGWVQRERGLIEEIHPGDVVWFPPGEKHWHGATAKTGMTHIAIQEALDGKVVQWMEHVTDEQYRSSGR
jgi:quercetin dioxygenase-like cupin family protein